MKVESFSLDHTKVVAPYIRKCGEFFGENGDVVTKFDVRFTQPNVEYMDIDGVHTLEHLLAGFLREEMNKVIDISPMGCRTGFYLIVFGRKETKDIVGILKKALNKVLDVQEVPAANEFQCGNYKDHSLEKAKQYAKKVLDENINDKVFEK